MSLKENQPFFLTPMNKGICILGICPNIGEPLVSLKIQLICWRRLCEL